MCMNCVAEGVHEPVAVTAAMRTLIEATRAIYATEWGGVGSALHIYLDDFNLDDGFVNDAHRDFVQSSIEYHQDDGYFPLPADGVALIWRCWDALLACTEAERLIAVAIAHHDLPEAEVGQLVTL